MIDSSQDECASSLLDGVDRILTKEGWIVDRWSQDGIINPVMYKLILKWDGHVHEASMPDDVTLVKGATVLHANFGWSDPSKTFQVDTDSVGPLAPWSVDLYFYVGDSEDVRFPHAPGLIILQGSDDVGLCKYSPWFSNSMDFVSFILDCTREMRSSFLVWWPPGAKISKELRVLIDQHQRVQNIEGLPFHKAMSQAGYVVTINSNFAMDALVKHMIVLCYGHACYRYEGAVYCLDDSAAITYDVFASRISFRWVPEIHTQVQDQIVTTCLEREYSIKTVATRIWDLVTQV